MKYIIKHYTLLEQTQQQINLPLNTKLLTVKTINNRLQLITIEPLEHYIQPKITILMLYQNQVHQFELSKFQYLSTNYSTLSQKTFPLNIFYQIPKS